MIIRIAITGPESTGKTWLAQELATHYQSVWVPEFARDYLFKLGGPYTYDDILRIAQNQFMMNNQETGKAKRFLFCDTELIVTKIWCEVKYGKCHQWIKDHIAKQHFGLYLLTDIDLAWEPDPQREHPQLREHLMGLYLKELQQQKIPFRVISGVKNDRLKCALSALEDF